MGLHENAHGIGLAPHTYVTMTVIFLPSYVHSYVCNVIVVSVFKGLQKHQLTTHNNYNHNFVIFALHVRHIEPN